MSPESDFDQDGQSSDQVLLKSDFDQDGLSSSQVLLKSDFDQDQLVSCYFCFTRSHESNLIRIV